MAIQKFEELNNLGATNVEVIPIEQYFDEMPLSEEEKEERIELAHELNDVFLFLFALFVAYKENNVPLNKATIVQQVSTRFRNVISIYPQYDLIKDDIDGYVDEYVSNCYDITNRNQDDAYYTSDDRAMIIAEEETNSVFNDFDYAEAIDLGKTKKQWVTMRDRRVRHTHSVLDGKTTGINNTFAVGNSLMLYPRDTSHNAQMKEIANCRCVCKYI